MLIAAFFFETFLIALLWIAMAVFNLWIWQKTKAMGNLLMLVGAGALGLVALLNSFGSGAGLGILVILGTAGIVVGYYLSVQKLIAPHLAELKKKIADATSEKSEG